MYILCKCRQRNFQSRKYCSNAPECTPVEMGKINNYHNMAAMPI